jgi:hypothetical protein
VRGFIGFPTGEITGLFDTPQQRPPAAATEPNTIGQLAPALASMAESF